MTDTPAPDALPDELYLIAPGDVPGGPARPTLSFSRTPTVLLTFAANRFTRAASREYQQKFGIGAMDWRMLVMLTREPGSTVSHAARTIGIDKAAVSRSLRRLETAGLAAAVQTGPDERRKSWTLTQAGNETHDRVLVHALGRLRQLMAGFDPEEIRNFTGYLARMLDNLDAAFDDDA
ncbi:MarR family winged helix-turn-helix transcriptional regulator [Antarcticimicrobium luteum]|uniref:MarR family transcriptional regulator n=1 Tax=Antarcticimicrobium luteum TaxID=2547397 RepID=A0A4R5UTN4_9RHOB|nr:MarR family transcriptional regulator [Antarcticimicrobium luteum]TDK42356.1 MarR family transcriptional regulator [Antarcticimicrobium luteum]